MESTTSPVPGGCFSTLYADEVKGKTNDKKNDASKSKPIKVSEMWRECISKTSLHGCNHIFDQRQWNMSRYIWIALIIIMGACLVLSLVLLYVDYKKYPFKSVWSNQQRANIVMPAITICLPGTIDMERTKQSPVLYDYISKTRSFFDLDDFFPNASQKEEFLNKSKAYMSAVSSSEYKKQTEFQIEDIFLYTEFSGKNLLENYEQDLWLRKTYDAEDSCWVLNGNSYNSSMERTLTRFDSFLLLLDVNADRLSPNVIETGLKVFFHESNKVHSLQKAYFFRPGSYIQILFSRVEHEYLNLPYGSFENNGCIDGESVVFRPPLRVHEKYSQGGCISDFLITEVISKCKCAPIEYKPYFKNVSECSLLELESCYTIQLNELLELTVVGDLAKNTGCFHECSFATYEIIASSAGLMNKYSFDYFRALNVSKTLEHARKNIVSLRIQPKDQTIQRIVHSPEITINSVVGSVGGYMGLFLGASLLTLTEFLEIMFFTIWLQLKRLYSYIKIRLV